NRIMVMPRRFVQILFICFFVVNGITTFYVSSGRFKKSGFLFAYRLFHNCLVMILTIKFLLDFWRVSEISFHQSPLVRLAAITYFGLVFLSLVSCMGCAHRWGNRICRMLEQLRKLEETTKAHGYTLPRGKGRFLNHLTVALVALLILRLATHMFLNVKRFMMGSHHPCNCFLSECMIFAMNSLVFCIMLEICRNWWKLQSSLEKLLLENQPWENQFTHLRNLLDMFQGLVDMTDEVCVVFRFVFLSYMMRNIWSGIRVGYMLVRVCLGHSAIEAELEYLQMVFITSIQPLLYSLMMNSLTHTTDSLLETTKLAIRGLYNQDNYVEKNMEWFSLQMTEQHTYVHIFGTYRLNRALIFEGCSVILLHVIYMVQCEYTQ
ncbi:hypothetical protein KR018_004534, partial [Drosophila ironensis]